MLKEGSPAFTKIRRLAIAFNRILRARKADPLPAWIDDGIDRNLAPIAPLMLLLTQELEPPANPRRFKVPITTSKTSVFLVVSNTDGVCKTFKDSNFAGT